MTKGDGAKSDENIYLLLSKISKKNPYVFHQQALSRELVFLEVILQKELGIFLFTLLKKSVDKIHRDFFLKFN